MSKSKKPKEYFRAWRLLHPFTYRTTLLLWYYRNRKRINLMFSRPNSGEDDEADEWLSKQEKTTIFQSGGS